MKWIDRVFEVALERVPVALPDEEVVEVKVAPAEPAAAVKPAVPGAAGEIVAH